MLPSISAPKLINKLSINIMQIRNNNERYGSIAISLHWLVALLIIGLLSLGLYMTSLPLGPQKLKLYGWHKATGLAVLALVLYRLFWRFINITPELLLPWWEKLAAQLMHWGLYGLMIAMPLTGWLMSSAAGFPVSFFGLFTVPSLMPANDEWRHLFASMHEYLAYVLIAAITLHILAALKHHFINKDTILRRIL